MHKELFFGVSGFALGVFVMTYETPHRKTINSITELVGDCVTSTFQTGVEHRILMTIDPESLIIDGSCKRISAPILDKDKEVNNAGGETILFASSNLK